MESGGVYYAFSTGTSLGNHLQALVDTSGICRPGWRSYTGHDIRLDAHCRTSRAWEAVNTQTSRRSSHSAATG